jgi:hypothetical protein
MYIFYEYNIKMLTWDTFPITYKRPEKNHYWVYLIWIRLSRKCTYASHNNVMENAVIRSIKCVNGTLTQMSSLPLTIVTSIGGWCSASEP